MKVLSPYFLLTSFFCWRASLEGDPASSAVFLQSCILLIGTIALIGGSCQIIDHGAVQQLVTSPFLLLAALFGFRCHDATPRSALTPYVGNLYTAPLPLWQVHNGAGLLCLGCQHLSAERKSEGGKGSSQAQAEKGGHQEGWHF